MTPSAAGLYVRNTPGQHLQHVHECRTHALRVTQGGTPRELALGLAGGVSLQLILGAPFLFAHPSSYVGRAFEFTRVRRADGRQTGQPCPALRCIPKAAMPSVGGCGAGACWHAQTWQQSKRGADGQRQAGRQAGRVRLHSLPLSALFPPSPGVPPHLDRQLEVSAGGDICVAPARAAPAGPAPAPTLGLCAAPLVGFGRHISPWPCACGVPCKRMPACGAAGALPTLWLCTLPAHILALGPPPPYPPAAGRFRREGGVGPALAAFWRREWRPARRSTRSMRANSGAGLDPRMCLYLVFTSNFVGILCARSLHFQFYSWCVRAHCECGARAMGVKEGAGGQLLCSTQ